VWRVWIFEEDVWLGQLHESGPGGDHHLAVVADQLCVVLPGLQQLAERLPDVQTLQNLYQALSLQLGLPWQQLAGAAHGDEGAEGRARALLFLLKTLHLHTLLRAFPHVDALLAMQAHLPRNASFVRQVRTLGRLQQIFLQTATQPHILLAWRRALPPPDADADALAFLRLCLLDVPPDEHDLFPFLAAVLRLPEHVLLSLHHVMAHVHDFQLQLLTLLFRKPQLVTLDAHCLANGIPCPLHSPLLHSPQHPFTSASAPAPLATSHYPASPPSSASLSSSLFTHSHSQSQSSLVSTSYPGSARVLSP
jgi:hypothetical protein